MYNSPVARYTFVYHQGRQAALVSHQPLWGCIFLRLDDIQRQAVDDIPQQVADDIQGLRLDLFTKVWCNKLTDKLEFDERMMNHANKTM